VMMPPNAVGAWLLGGVSGAAISRRRWWHAAVGGGQLPGRQQVLQACEGHPRCRGLLV
jgi:hypothetical protein